MSYQVLARKWRPQNFQTLVGQEHVLKPLMNALTQQRLHHAYLFTGIQGVGKTTIARILARSLNCETGVSATPCGQCSACIDISQGCFIDLIEVDAASRTKVEDIRELLDNVQYAPSRGRYKVYLIDEVHMLSNHSFNALLKTLEEPPAHVKFLLATTDPHRLPVTILSRCLQFHLKTLTPELISQHLQTITTQENVQAEPQALFEIAKSANGSLRDALSLLDQAIAYCQNSLTLTETRQMLGTIEQSYLWAILDNLAANNGNALLTTIQQMAELNTDFANILEDLLSLLHQIAIQQVVPEAPCTEPTVANYAKKISAQDIQLFYQIALIGRRDLKLAPTARIGFEMILLRMLAFYPETSSTASPAAPAAPPAANLKLNDPTNYQSAPSSSSKPQLASSQEGAPSVSTSANSKPVFAKTKPLNWSELIAELKLSGMVQALASHCVLLSWEEPHLKLMLSPKYKLLLNEQILARLTQTLQQHLQQPIHIQIEMGDSQQLSPAEQAQQLLTEREQQAQSLIENNPQVQALISKFNATLINTQAAVSEEPPLP